MTTQKLKMWQNSKIQIETNAKKKLWQTKLKTQNKTKQNLKIQNVTKLKNASCEKTQKLKLWQNSTTQIMTKLKNSNCDQTKRN